MKTLKSFGLFTLVTLIFLLKVTGLSAADTPKQDDGRFSHVTVSFFNAGDSKDAMPYMSLIFDGIDDANSEKVTKWRNEIDAEIKKQGGVVTGEDYKKISPIVVRYVSDFIKTDANYVAMEFPRLKQGILLVNKKATKK